MEVTEATNTQPRSQGHDRTILEMVDHPYCELDLDGRHIFLNEAFSQMCGYCLVDLPLTAEDYYASSLDTTVQSALQSVKETVSPVSVQAWSLRHRSGHLLHLRGTLVPLLGADGDVGGIGAIFMNITELRLAESALRDSEERFQALTKLSSDWYWEQDEALKIVRFEGRQKPAADGQHQMIGKHIDDLGFNVYGEQNSTEQHRLIMASQKSYRDIVVSRVSSTGVLRYFSLNAEPAFEGTGRFLGYRGVAREITEQTMAKERVAHLSTHDGLTDLPNRHMMGHLLDIAISTAARHDRQCALLIIDLDRFKLVNDTLGHAAGDELLSETAIRLKLALRDSDILARLGGDEFAILIQDLQNVGQAATVAGKILAATAKPLTLGGQECRVTASIGVSVYPKDGVDSQEMVRNAEMAMYHAKGTGKNSFRFYSEEVKTRALERMVLETKLRHALELGEFSLNYQAKVNLQDDTITGVEALLRWNNPELGSVSPAQFIPITEETGLIVPIGLWVIRTACMQNVAWQKQGLAPICIAVNLSVRQFSDANLLEDIARIVSETGMDPGLLELEITEGMVVQDQKQAVAVLTAIKAMGIRLAIDDFGTGYSSLGQLKNFPIDTLKVDRSFIQDLATDSEDKAITKAIIAMGRTLNLTVVAEGVETEDQKNFLREHACDQMQGFYFSRPISGDAFGDLLRDHMPDPVGA
jgi:diguanylate cyclase (GGDEF)-like protein/PAS domain S-box-containing protein